VADASDAVVMTESSAAEVPLEEVEPDMPEQGAETPVAAAPMPTGASVEEVPEVLEFETNAQSEEVSDVELN